jgi:hypothetical protein
MVLVEPVSGREVEDQVEAMSRALGELSRRIAVKVKTQQPREAQSGTSEGLQ